MNTYPHHLWNQVSHGLCGAGCLCRFNAAGHSCPLVGGPACLHWLLFGPWLCGPVVAFWYRHLLPRPGPAVPG
jgi:hypothetical protein